MKCLSKRMSDIYARIHSSCLTANLSQLKNLPLQTELLVDALFISCQSEVNTLSSKIVSCLVQNLQDGLGSTFNSVMERLRENLINSLKGVDDNRFNQQFVAVDALMNQTLNHLRSKCKRPHQHSKQSVENQKDCDRVEEANGNREKEASTTAGNASSINLSGVVEAVASATTSTNYEVANISPEHLLHAVAVSGGCCGSVLDAMVTCCTSAGDQIDLAEHYQLYEHLGHYSLLLQNICHSMRHILRDAKQNSETISSHTNRNISSEDHPLRKWQRLLQSHRQEVDCWILRSIGEHI